MDRSTPLRAELEDKLDFLFDFYRGQQEQRRWYGFWNYGDVMHTYDSDRHVWRYDVGGYAWDNSELSPTCGFGTCTSAPAAPMCSVSPRP